MASGSRDDELANTATAGGGGDSDQAPPLGATLGRYRLERMLGEGGMGSVHAAFDPDLERRVALKVLRDARSGDQARQRLLREARAMARLTHANVVTVHEVGSASGRDYVAMELVDGETLAEWLRAEKRGEAEILDAFRAAGRGLAAAHAAGLVHRDFKPHNVLRRRDGRICVTDFGLARGVEIAATGLEATVDLGPSSSPTSTPSSLSGLTATGSVLGTPAYMAPEQWAGGTVGPAADQFAYCVALWEALTGERPFRGATLDDLKREVAHGPADLDASKLPRFVRRALVRGLDPDPDKRWPSMDTLLAKIARVERRSKAALFAVGGAVVASAAIYVALGRSSAPAAAACEAPPIDPQELAAAKFPREDVAAAFQRDLGAWRAARDQACAEPADKRGPKLACLDGVLARAKTIELAAGRAGAAASPDEMISQLVDPAVCSLATPPRFVLAPSEDAQAAAAFALAVPSNDGKPDEAKIASLVAKPGIEPCARTLALFAQAEIVKDVPHEREIEGQLATAAEQCADDRLRADALLLAAPLAFEVPKVGNKGRAAVEKAKVAVDRVPTPDLLAQLDELRANIAGQDKHWDEAFAATERAIAGYGKRGMRREQVQAVETSNSLRLSRNELADLEAMRAAVAKWKPVAEAIGSKRLVRGLELTDAYGRLFLGDLAGAHAEIMRLWKPSPPAAGPHRRVDGIVVDASGKPVAGATVAAAPLLWIDSIGPLPFGDTAGLRIVTTDAAGKYEIDDAPVQGGLYAGLGDRRVTQDLTDHAKLVLQPTRRVAGKVDLAGISRSQVFVMIAPESGATLVKGFTTLDPDSGFAIDGVITGAVSVGVMRWNAERSGDIAFTKLPASSQPVTGLQLATTHGHRKLVVLARSELAASLDGAQIFVMAGRVQVKTAEELNKRGRGSAGSMRFAHPVVGEAVPAAAHDKLRPGDLVAEFDDVPVGEVTACAIAISGDVGDPQLWRKLQDHVKDLQVRCVTANASEEAIVVEAPPQKRFD